MVSAPVLAIDGPGGSGKGTICRHVQQALGWYLLDSGAIYRALAVAADRRRLGADDVEALVALAHALDVRFQPVDGGEHMVLVDGVDMTLRLRSEKTGNLASQLAVIPEVRAALLDRQRDFRKPPGLVADGRDMGTVVFPDATVKIYLTASAEERARRRHKQLKEQGVSGNLSTLLQEITERDERDASRSVAPLMPASDAEVIDTTGLAIEAVVQRVMTLVRQRIGRTGSE
ncbi:MAG: (d)CMP kinase [Aquisalimonadaceae bacterium]